MHAAIAVLSHYVTLSSLQADEVQRKQAAAISAWTSGAGWVGPKHARKLVKTAGATAAGAAVRLSLAKLIASLHTVPGLEIVVPKPLLESSSLAATSDAALSPPALPDAALKKAYLGAVKAIHPDKTSGSSLLVRRTAQSAFTELGAAWEAWCDAKDAAAQAAAAAEPNIF
jgi:hypothetical protein